jgi:fatty acid amide hydrolase 2
VDDLLHSSGVALARRIREGEITSVDVVDAHIAAVDRVNPTINAVIADRYDLARQEAASADATVAGARRDGTLADLPPMLGVPCTVKECFALEGMPQTAGLVARKGYIAPEDGETVSRLRSSGAIPMGSTNLSELCMWLESDNRVYGRSNNPYNPGRIVGGSSGGEGAIVGSGASPFGLGSDIGGSIRMPAFFNGVFGHKPSGGLVPGTGQFPAAGGKAMRYLTTGPLARRAEDLMPLLRVLAGPDGVDPECEAFDLRDPADVDLSTLTVLHVPDNGSTPVSGELRAAQERVAAHLESLGATIKRSKLELLKRSYDIWGAALHAHGTQSFNEMLGNGKGISGTWEMLRWVTGQSPHTLPAILLAAFEWSADFPKGRGARFIEMGDTLRRELHDELGDHGVLLFPSYSRTAPPHYQPLLRPFQWVYTAILNVMHVPATQVPLGLDSQGLPLGIQVAAPHGRDDLSSAVALELERAFGGWVPPAILRGEGA